MSSLNSEDDLPIPASGPKLLASIDIAIAQLKSWTVSEGLDWNSIANSHARIWRELLQQSREMAINECVPNLPRSQIGIPAQVALTKREWKSFLVWFRREIEDELANASKNAGLMPLVPIRRSNGQGGRPESSEAIYYLAFAPRTKISSIKSKKNDPSKPPPGNEAAPSFQLSAEPRERQLTRNQNVLPTPSISISYGDLRSFNRIVSGYPLTTASTMSESALTNGLRKEYATKESDQPPGPPVVYRLIRRVGADLTSGFVAFLLIYLATMLAVMSIPTNLNGTNESNPYRQSTVPAKLSVSDAASPNVSCANASPQDSEKRYEALKKYIETYANVGSAPISTDVCFDGVAL